MWDGTELHVCDDFRDPLRVGRARTATTGRSRRSWSPASTHWKVRGSVLSLIPLRNRRTDPDGNPLVTRISEGLTQWTLDDGRVGYGLSEYLDQIVDGRPVGIAE